MLLCCLITRAQATVEAELLARTALHAVFAVPGNVQQGRQLLRVVSALPPLLRWSCVLPSTAVLVVRLNACVLRLLVGCWLLRAACSVLLTALFRVCVQQKRQRHQLSGVSIVPIHGV